jgi:molybdopterin molybdotransferase
MSDIRETGFVSVTRLGEARERLREAVTHVGRTERLPLTEAAGRALAEAVTAARDVPHFPRAAMDGYAVRSEDTFGASARAPQVLRQVEGTPGPGEATRVHTGSEVPAGADAVVMVEHVETFGEDVEVFDAVAGGENVAPPGEDVEEGQPLYEAGHQLRPSDLGLLRATGREEVRVHARPSVAVIPTGEELVDADPAPGEAIETNGLTVSALVEAWGGEARYRDVVTDDPEVLREAIAADLDADIVVTTGGSSVGERDLLPEVISGMGEVFVHGVALKPGHPVALGRIEETPVLMLPGYPVACIVNAMQFLRPALKWCGGLPLTDPPTVAARLERKIASEPGTKTFARVRLDGEGDERVAVPTRASGSGVLSSVALADGWVVVPEEREGIPADETVSVERWEWYA